MTKLFTRTLMAAAAAGAVAAAAPLFAQASKVATVNAADALFNAAALPTALQAIESKYTAQIKVANDRRSALQTQIKPMLDQLDTNRDGQLDQTEQQAAIQAQKPQIKQINDANTAAQVDIDKQITPVTLARIYVFDQLQQRYNTSLDGLIRTRQIGLVIPSTAALRQAPGVDLTSTIRTEIDKPLAIDPPATWKPTREAAALLETYFQALAEAEQRAAQQQAAQAQQPGAAPRPAAPAPGAAPVPAPARPARDRNGDPIRQ